MRNNLIFHSLKPIVIPFICSFVLGLGFILFVQPHLESAFTSFQRSFALVQSSRDMVAATFGEEIDALKEGRFLEYVQDEIASVKVSSDGDFRERATEFFQKAARTNLFGLGPLFSLEYARITKRIQQRDERVKADNEKSYVSTVLFKEVEQFNDFGRFYHKVIENGQVVVREFELDRFSMELPVQMQPIMDRLCAAVGTEIGSCEVETN